MQFDSEPDYKKITKMLIDIRSGFSTERVVAEHAKEESKEANLLTPFVISGLMCATNNASFTISSSKNPSQSVNSHT